MKFFEEFSIGERHEFGSHTFSAEEIKRFASAFDPQSFHLDEEAAAKKLFRAIARLGLAHDGGLDAAQRPRDTAPDQRTRLGRS